MSEPAKQQEPCRICGKRPPYADGMELCSVCMGIERSEEEHDVPQQAKATGLAKRIAAERERPCSICGRIPSQTKFYPSRPDKCVDCIKARIQQEKAQQPPAWSPIEQQEASSSILEVAADPAGEIDSQPDPFESPELSYGEESSDPIEKQPMPDLGKCKDCGATFEVYKNGVTRIRTLCQDCLSARHRRGIREGSRSGQSAYQLVLDLDDDQAIFDALVTSAKRERRTISAQAITLLERVLLPVAGG